MIDFTPKSSMEYLALLSSFCQAFKVQNKNYEKSEKAIN